MAGPHRQDFKTGSGCEPGRRFPGKHWQNIDITRLLLLTIRALLAATDVSAGSNNAYDSVAADPQEEAMYGTWTSRRGVVSMTCRGYPGAVSVISIALGTTGIRKD